MDLFVWLQMSKIKILVYAVNKHKHFSNNLKESWIHWLICWPLVELPTGEFLPDVSWIGGIQRKFSAHEQRREKETITLSAELSRSNIDLYEIYTAAFSDNLFLTFIYSNGQPCPPPCQPLLEITKWLQSITVWDIEIQWPTPSLNLVKPQHEPGCECPS